MAIRTDDMPRVIREQRLGSVATVCPDGTPTLAPKGTTTVWDETTSCLRTCAPHVRLRIWGRIRPSRSMSWTGVRAKGTG